MFIRLSTTAQMINYFGFKPHPGVEMNLSHDKSATLLSHPQIVPVTGSTAGLVQAETKLMANRVYRLVFGTVTFPRNPGLLKPTWDLVGLPVHISAPAPILYGLPTVELALTVQPYKSVDIGDLPAVAALMVLQRT